MPEGEFVFDGIKAFRCFLRECVKEPQPLSYFVELEARRLGISKRQSHYHTLYMNFYRFVKELEEQGLLRIEKTDGLLFVAAPFDLIRGGRKTRNSEEKTEESENPAERYRRISEERREAVGMMWETDWRPDWEWEKVKGDIALIDAEIQDLFKAWLDRVSMSYIVLRARYDDVAPQWRVLKSQTRFTSKKRKKQLYARYYAAWERASERHDEGVFLTLTTDWRRFGNLWDAVKGVLEAWDNFRRWMQQRNKGKRLEYIKVAEFTEAGFLHLHVVIFGVSWLAEKYDITEEWERLGIGKITYIYGIQKDSATGMWLWKKRKPRGAKKDVMRYLKKYLSKIFDERQEFKQNLSKTKQHLYWATLTRFFTVSRSLIGEGKPPKKLPPLYEYWGIFRWDELPIRLLEIADIDYG